MPNRDGLRQRRRRGHDHAEGNGREPSLKQGGDPLPGQASKIRTARPARWLRVGPDLASHSPLRARVPPLEESGDEDPGDRRHGRGRPADGAPSGRATGIASWRAYARPAGAKRLASNGRHPGARRTCSRPSRSASGGGVRRRREPRDAHALLVHADDAAGRLEGERSGAPHRLGEPGRRGDRRGRGAIRPGIVRAGLSGLRRPVDRGEHAAEARALQPHHPGRRERRRRASRRPAAPVSSCDSPPSTGPTRGS